MDLVTACDIRLCTKDAMFSVKETQVAMVPDLGTIPRLTRIVGRGIYKEMVFIEFGTLAYFARCILVNPSMLDALINLDSLMRFTKIKKLC